MSEALRNKVFFITYYFVLTPSIPPCILTLVTRCVMSEALRKKVFFITLRWFDSSVHTSEQRVSVLATSSNVDTESGTSVSSTGRRIGGGLCSCVTKYESRRSRAQTESRDRCGESTRRNFPFAGECKTNLPCVAVLFRAARLL